MENAIIREIKVNGQYIYIYIEGNKIIVNPDKKNTKCCQTVKAQNYKNTLQNVFHGGTFGCTGVIEIDRD